VAEENLGTCGKAACENYSCDASLRVYAFATNVNDLGLGGMW
jgi:hypothetical protein